MHNNYVYKQKLVILTHWPFQSHVLHAELEWGHTITFQTKHGTKAHWNGCTQESLTTSFARWKTQVRLYNVLRCLWYNVYVWILLPCEKLHTEMEEMPILKDPLSFPWKCYVAVTFYLVFITSGYAIHSIAHKYYPFSNSVESLSWFGKSQLGISLQNYDITSFFLARRRYASPQFHRV